MGWRSSGSFANATTVIATEWEGGLRGALQDNGNTIRWANGTVWFRSAAASFRGSSPAPTPPQPVSGRHYAMVNYTGDVRNPHDFTIDWANCRVSEHNQEFSEGTEDIRISVCRPRSRLTMRTDFRATGYWIQYDWVFLDDGTLVGGYYHDPGSYGPSVGKWIQ
jgi:hypothetical protein